jgi:Nif-specific regulatory protein
MVIMTRRRLILPEDLPLPVEAGEAEPSDTRRRRRVVSPTRDATRASSPDGVSSLREVERQQIIQALSRTNGVQARAAALLGITPRQLAYRLRKYAIVRAFQFADEARAAEA